MQIPPSTPIIPLYYIHSHSDQISGDRIDFDDGTFPQIGKDNANVKLQQVKVKRKLTLRRCCSPIPQVNILSPLRTQQSRQLPEKHVLS